MYILIFLLLIAVSAFFSSVEIAFFSLTHGQIKLMLEKKEKKAEIIWKLKENPQKLLITILIGNNVVNVLTASIATVLTTNMFGSYGIGIATGVVTLVILIFGEITPKSFAQKNNKWLAQKSAIILYILSNTLYPIIWLLMKFNHLIIHKIFKIEDSSLVTEEEIRSLARLGVETGAIEYRERELIENVFKFNDITVGQIVTPRYKVISLNGNVPIDQISHFVAQSGFSRYPVFVGDEDDIIGYVHVNDIMKVLNSNEREKELQNFVRPLRSINEDEKIEPLFRSMIKAKEHMVLVNRKNDSDELLGIVTVEDILEELVGEIQDETDEDKEVEKL